MATQDELYKEISIKIKKLKEKNNRLKKDNEDLQNSIFAYLKKMDEQQRKIDALTSSVNAKQISNQLGINKDLLKNIDMYIKKIDKCIDSVKAEL